MEHTFLFQEGFWSARGYYFDDADRPLHLAGKTRITHLEGMWVNEGEMEITAADQSVKFYNRYEIVPFREGKSHTTWESPNPDLGALLGVFVIVDDVILSTCRTKNGGYTGTEILLRVTETHYKNRGMLFKGNDKLSSWSIDLHRESSWER